MKNDISVSIGCRIKYVRNCLNLTQVQFSKTLGVTSSHISRLEHGIGNISTALARSISKIYAVNLNSRVYVVTTPDSHRVLAIHTAD